MGLKDSIKKLSNSLGLSRPEPEHMEVDDEELDLARLQESESESDVNGSSEEESEEAADAAEAAGEQSGDASDSEEDEDVPLSDAELDDDADVVPYQKVTINNTAALQRSLKAIALPAATKAQFVEHLSVSAAEPITLRDIYDDTERELAFYKQALEAALEGRKLARKNDIPFSRPVDFFAEMLKSDEHMGRVKAKLVDQERNKMAGQEARKQRELKKYGKKVQHEKLQQRQKDKREMLDKITGLKRKRKDAMIGDDQFGVEVEDALADKKQQRDQKYRLGAQRGQGGQGGVKKQPNRKRLAKNTKYGSGHKRGEKRNTADSSMDVSGFRNRRK